jgi:hypothetical protein
MMYEADLDIPSFRLFEDGCFSIGCKESQRYFRSVGRINAEDCCPSLERELQRALLPGSARENTGTTQKKGVRQMRIFRRVVLGLMLLGMTLSTLAILSCGGSDDDNDETRLQANLSAANERPAPPSPNPAGNGTAVLIISDDEQRIDYTLTYAAVNNVTQAHIHVVNSPDLAGPIILFLCTNVGLGANVPCAGAGPIPTPQPCPQGSSVTITGTLTAADLSCKAATATSPEVLSFASAIGQLRAGNTYTNVHSVANPGGDIRGTDIFVE